MEDLLSFPDSAANKSLTVLGVPAKLNTIPEGSWLFDCRISVQLRQEKRGARKGGRSGHRPRGGSIHLERRVARKRAGRYRGPDFSRGDNRESGRGSVEGNAAGASQVRAQDRNG